MSHFYAAPLFSLSSKDKVSTQFLSAQEGVSLLKLERK